MYISPTPSDLPGLVQLHETKKKTFFSFRFSLESAVESGSTDLAVNVRITCINRFKTSISLKCRCILNN